MKRIKVGLVIIFIHFSACWAASEYTHAITAQIWFDCVKQNYSKEEKQSFILGTLFPDIRYLAKLSKEKTHDRRWDIQLQEIYDMQDPFMSGMKLHAWVDLKFRLAEKNAPDMVHPINRYLIERGYDFGASTDTLFKLTLDHLFQSLYPIKCEEIFEALEHIHPGELVFTTESIIRQWHTTLSCFFSDRIDIMLAAGKGVYGIDHGILQQWSVIVPVLAKDSEIKKYGVTLLKDIFDELSELSIK